MKKTKFQATRKENVIAIGTQVAAVLVYLVKLQYGLDIPADIALSIAGIINYVVMSCKEAA